MYKHFNWFVKSIIDLRLSFILSKNYKFSQSVGSCIFMKRLDAYECSLFKLFLLQLVYQAVSENFVVNNY